MPYITNRVKGGLMKPVQIYSPSQTVNYGFCPRYWALKRRHLVPRVIAYPELCAVLGHGFSYFAATVNSGRGIIGEALQLATAEMDAELQHRLLNGGRRITADKDKEFADTLPTLLRKAANLLMANNPITRYKIVAVEQDLSDEDKGRPDVVVLDSEGQFPVDYKLKVKLEAQWMSKELRKYDRSWQMRHYASGLSSLRYAIVLIVLGPKPSVHFEPYSISSPILRLHQNNAVQLWANMQASSDDPRHQLTNPKHYDEYGPCEMVDACETYMLDEQAMSLQYVQLPRRIKVTNGI